MRKTILLGLSLLFLISYSHAQITSFGWQLYQDSALTLKYPNTWKLQDKMPGNRDVKFKFDGSLVTDLNGGAIISVLAVPDHYSKLSSFAAGISIGLTSLSASSYSTILLPPTIEDIYHRKDSEHTNELGDYFVMEYDLVDNQRETSGYMMMAIWKHGEEYFLLFLNQLRKKDPKTRKLFLQITDSFFVK